MTDQKEPDMMRIVVVIVAIIAIAIVAYQIYISLRKKKCETSEDCEPGENCIAGVCVSEGPPVDCRSDSDCDPDEVCRNGICIPDPGVGPIEGEPDFLSIDQDFPLTTSHTVQFGELLHLSTFTGFYHLTQSCPGCWFKRKVGIQMFAHVEPPGHQAHQVRIFKDEPYNGRGEGWHPFSTAPGLDNVFAITIKISRYYGIGDSTPLLDAINGEAVVFR